MSSLLDRIIPTDSSAWWAWYSKYLRSERWKEKRQRVIERADGQCEVKVKGKRCLKRIVHVHHLTYKRVGKERMTDLLGVCRRHHEQLHGRRLR